MDLGECSKLHDLALRADFETAQKLRDYFYDIDAMEHLESFISECDRKVELAKRRLKETQEELSEEATAKAEVIHALGEQIGTKLARAEEEGAKGDVDGSLKYLEEVEDLKKRKLGEETEYRNSMPASSYQQQKLRVCEVCSAYLGIHDNDRRLADHFGGKLHLGFITIRDKLDELKATVQDRRLQREKEREERRRTRRSKSRSRSRDRGGDRRRRKSRSRSRSRRHRSRSRSRDRRRRSRDRDRRRSRSRDRRSRSRTSRSKDKKRRSRSRDRRRSRSRSKRSRHKSRSRSRSRRSGSKSKPREGDAGQEQPNGESSSAAASAAAAETGGQEVQADNTEQAAQE